MLSFLAISVASYIALYRIRSFFKSKGLSHRTNTRKIAFQAAIFSIFLIELVVIALNIIKPFMDKNLVQWFAASLNLADIGFILVLYNLGTMQVKERYLTEATTTTSTRFTVNELIHEDESDDLNLTDE